MSSVIKELYQYREMTYSLIKRELRGKYKASFLGFFWTILIPLFQYLVYTVVFSVFLKSNIEKYYIFLIVGLFPWNFFSASVTSGASCVVCQENLIKKIYFPRLVLPIAYVTSAFVNMLISFIVVFAVLIFSGHGLSFSALCFLPLVLLIEYIMALGVCMLVSALTVYLRDLEYILSILMLAWIYFTPVFYQMDIVPEELKVIFNLNPMTPVVIAYQQILYGKSIPQLDNLMIAAFFGIAMLGIGYLVFTKIQKKFVEEL